MPCHAQPASIPLADRPNVPQIAIDRDVKVIRVSRHTRHESAIADDLQQRKVAASILRQDKQISWTDVR
jgi:hypothetical protein